MGRDGGEPTTEGTGPKTPDGNPRLISCPCTEESLLRPEMLEWADRIRPAWDTNGSGLPVFIHRKLWEWLFSIEALSERSMLQPSRRGLGFGVGQDPLAALFADLGCELVATDVDPTHARRAGWVDSGEYAMEFSDLNSHGICETTKFQDRVQFRNVDMRRIPDDLRDFDFTWSSCAFEHLGSLSAGLEFILRQMDCLRPGGFAVHTTEYNCVSDGRTVGSGPTVLYRKRDLDRLVVELRRLGHLIDIDFDTGSSDADLHIDRLPFEGAHLKVQQAKFVTTSMALVIQKDPSGTSAHWTPDTTWIVRRTSQRVRFSGFAIISRIQSRVTDKLFNVGRRIKGKLLRIFNP